MAHQRRARRRRARPGPGCAGAGTRWHRLPRWCRTDHVSRRCCRSVAVCSGGAVPPPPPAPPPCERCLRGAVRGSLGCNVPRARRPPAVPGSAREGRNPKTRQKIEEKKKRKRSAPFVCPAFLCRCRLPSGLPLRHLAALPSVRSLAAAPVGRVRCGCSTPSRAISRRGPLHPSQVSRRPRAALTAVCGHLHSPSDATSPLSWSFSGRHSSRRRSTSSAVLSTPCR